MGTLAAPSLMAHIIIPSAEKDLASNFGATRPGRGKTRGSFVSDLTDLGKAVVLCGMCERKFNPAVAGYERRQAIPGYENVRGPCDGCGTEGIGTLFCKKQERQ